MRRNGVAAMMLISLVAMAGEPENYRIDRGVQIPLSLMNDVSTKNAAVGDPVYLRTTFPVVSGGRMAIPPGSWVTGTITEVRRARRGQHGGQLQIRFDFLLLANGVRRGLRGNLGAHPAVGAERDKAGAAKTIVLLAATGAVIGPMAQLTSGNFGYGGAVGGAAAGAAAGAILVLAGRGPEVRIVRELARRLGIHANTVSAAYRDLAARGWVSKRRGSGVYVREAVQAQARQNIDGFARGCIEEAAAQGFTLEALQLALTKIASEGRIKEWVVVHSDAALARVLAREIEEAIGCKVSSGDFEQARGMLRQDSGVLVSPAQAARIAPELGGVAYRTLGLKSMEEMLAGRPRPGATALIGVVSRSESILGWAGTLLSALGFSPAAGCAATRIGAAGGED
jgi:DNA-binding transcriptional regulator YhcF (GntR family)